MTRLRTRTIRQKLPRSNRTYGLCVIQNPQQHRYYWTSVTKDRGATKPQTPGAISTLIDEVGKKTEFHECYHVSERYEYSRVGFASGPVPENPPEQEMLLGYSGVLSGTVVSDATTVGRISVIPDASPAHDLSLDWRKAYEALLDDVHGLLPAQKSLAVNIAEFSQLKHLVPGITKSILGILKWVSRNPNRRIKVRYQVQGRRGRDIRTATVKVSSMAWSLRDLAQLHLAYSFGVAPLGEDIGELAGKLYEAKAHLNWYRAFADAKPHVVRASVSASASDDDSVTQFSAYRVRDNRSTVVTGTLGAYVTVWPESEDVQNRRLLNQILGLNVPLQIGWELVPFSFVVDWFLPVGQVLGYFEPKRYFGSLAARVTFGQMWHTVKTVVQATRYFESAPGVNGRVRRNLDWICEDGWGRKISTVYNRQKGFPVFSLIPPKGVFKLKQWALSLSLVVTRLFRGKR